MQDQTSPQIIDRDGLIEGHRSYVRALAVEIMQSIPVHIDLDELIAYGYVGLIEAAERFDPLRGVAFTTFSYYRINGAIYDGLREMGHLSRGALARLRFAAQASDLLQAAADDESVHADTATSVEDDIAGVQAIIDSLIPAYLLSLSSDNLPDIPDAGAISTAQIEQSELINLVMQLKDELPEDEQELLDAIYFKHIPMKDVALSLGISKSWISRLHARAIKHLRDQMKKRGLFPADSSAGSPAD